MSKRILLFTRTACAKCPAAKEYVTKKNISCEIINVDESGMEMAIEYNITSVPSFIIIDDNMLSPFTYDQFNELLH